MQIFNQRLHPGTDLKQALQELQKQHQLQASVVLSSVGSLAELRLRLAGASAQNAAGVLSFSGPFEILSLNGTLGADGVHMHLCVSDKDGHCWGGHLLEGCKVYTTVELVLLEQQGVQFRREQDPATGFKELKIR